MKIGIVGVGHIGKSLALKFSAAGHEVKVANSRGPETIPADVLSTGARAVTADEAVLDVDVIILSVPPSGVVKVSSLFVDVPSETVVIDTSNYYPHRDGKIDALESGQVESLWVAEQLGRPIAKAWNSIGSDSLAKRGVEPGVAGRIALPVAADRDVDRDVAMALVEQSGFDAVDAGPLTESWRQQPGTPPYCTDLTAEQLTVGLATADRALAPKQREASNAAISKQFGDTGTNPDADFAVGLNRRLFASHIQF